MCLYFFSHGNLSLRDGFLDVLEELGRCAALDFVIWRFLLGFFCFHGMYGNAVVLSAWHSDNIFWGMSCVFIKVGVLCM